MAEICRALWEKDMIIDKKRVVAIVLAFVLVCLSLVSCSDEGNALGDLETISDRFIDDSSTDTEAYNVSYIGLVIPDDCTSQLALAAAQLAKDISAQLNIECNVLYDEEDVIDREGYCEISLGGTNRDGAVLATDGLRDKDYVCMTVNGHTVIGGGSDDATLVAIQRFTSEILPCLSADLVIPKDKIIKYTGEYELDQLLLCGFDISDYVLLCSSEGAKEFAVFLRDGIAEKYGARLDVLNTSNRIDGRKEIALCIDKQSAGAYLFKQGEDIVAIADSSYGLSYLTERLYDMLLVDDDRTVSCDMSQTIFSDCGGDEISIITVTSSLKSDKDKLEDTTNVAKFINNSGSDIVLIGRMSWETWDFVKYNLSDAYTVLEFSQGSENVYPVAYRKNKVKLVGGGVEYSSQLSIQRLTFEHMSAGTVYSLNIMASSSSGDYGSDVVNSLVGDTAALTVVTTPMGEMSLEGGKVAVVLSSRVSIYDADLYHGIFYRSDRTVMSDANVNNSDVYTSYVTLKIGVRYCDSYLKLVSENSR